MAVTGIAFPEQQQWLGLARELASGTAITPAATMPIDSTLPDDKPTMLKDVALRGDMAVDGGLIQGTEIAEVAPKGNVYIDTIGHFLFNILGDYTATGAAGTGSTTLSAQCAAGATTATVASISGFSNGQAVQIGVSGDGNPEIVVLSAAPSGSTITFANTPARFTHASGKAVAGVVAPFVHVFSLLNSGQGQPPTHTLTHHQGISATYGARQYASWCASGLDFEFDVEKLFTHTTKGMSYLGAIPTVTPVNSFSSALAQPNWRFLCGVGGVASGGTLLSDIQNGSVSIARALQALYTLSNQQTPYVIGRAGLEATGKFTVLAQDETPLIALFNNTQPQLQFVISNGLSGSNLLSCQFDLQIGAYDAVKLAAAKGFFEYDVTFRSIANTTNGGQSGGRSPIKVTLNNAVPTY